jgi:glycerol kinase
MPFVLSLDEGTTSARAALYNERGERVGMHSVPFESLYPHPGWVEQDATAIWRAQMDAASAVLLQQRVAPSAIAACGIANQRETTVVWDRRTGQPVAPAIVWQCRRTADFCAELQRSANGELIENKTGLVIDAYFSASKIRWILEFFRQQDPLDSGKCAGRLCESTRWRNSFWQRGYVADLEAYRRSGACHGLLKRIAHHADGPCFG